MTRVAVVYHSRGGKTRELAKRVAQGARSVAGVEADLVDVGAGAVPWEALAGASAIVLGCPTYMGGVSAELKAMLDATSHIWAVQGWRDKIAAGFTHSAAPSGDKLSTLMQMAVFAAQHGMVWVGLGLPPPFATAGDGAADINRLGSHLGAMAQSRERDRELPPGDLATAEHLGRRVAELTLRLEGEPAGDAHRHPTTRDWVLPSRDRPALPAPLSRTNLRALAARRERFEHHLTVVATIGDAQLEIATASEPVYFAHGNLSDELAVALPTGDALVDGFPLRTFVLETETAELFARYNHRPLDLLLHPYGSLHWPGMLRAPYEPFSFPPGSRRTGLVLVACASRLTPPTDRPAETSAARLEDVKRYAPAPDGLPLMLADLEHDAARDLATVCGARLELVVAPAAIARPCGAWVVVLTATKGSDFADGDLVRVPAGSELPGAGIERALVLSSPTREIDAAPASWSATPSAPFAPFEEGPAGSLPLREAGLLLTPLSDRVVAATVHGATARDAQIPRYWLARMLFRVALHGYRLGYVETYEGFYWDDRDGTVRMGVRGVGEVQIDPARAPAVVERIYRAVAPPGYVERLT